MAKKTLYINITEQTVALMLIANILKLNKYKLFLLYETFGNDCFLFFELFKDYPFLEDLTEFRLKRCFLNARSLTPVLHGQSAERLSTTELRAYQQLKPDLYENKFKLEEQL